MGMIRPPEGFETFAEAKQRRDAKVKFLEGGNRKHRRAAVKLKRCRRGQRCRLGSCDVCQRFARLRLLKAMAPIAHFTWTRASVIPAKMLIEPGELDALTLDTFAMIVNKRLERSSLRERIASRSCSVFLPAISM